MRKISLLFLSLCFFIFSIISFSTEIPHEYIWKNPNKEVTKTETLKKYKEKAELNITVTKLKSDPIIMAHDKKNKQINFTINSQDIRKTNGNLKFENDDKIFVSEMLVEIPSISTTNGRRKINGLKKLNKSLSNGEITDGKLKWTVKDLRSIDTQKSVTVEYTTFPKELYVGITDKNYNLKKVFVSKISEMELYDLSDLAGYVNVYSEDVKLNNKYDYDMSDVVVWTKDNQFVDIKFAEFNLNIINDMNLINKNPYLGIENKDVLIKGTKGQVVRGTLHLIDNSFSSNIPMRLKEEELKEKIFTKKSFTGTSTLELKTLVYIRLKGEDYKKLKEDTYTINKGIVYGHDNGVSEAIKLTQMYINNSNIQTGKTIDLDFWLFGTDFSDKVNYVINPRNNGTGNLEERALDEKTGITDTTVLTKTDSVFDINGRGVKYDFYDTDVIEIVGLKDVIPQEQNKGNFEKYKNKWATATFSGYKVKARIWSDYDGIELDFEKTSSLNISNDGVRRFKLIHKNKDGKIIQTWNINLYVNNIKYYERAGYNISYRATADIKGYNNQNYYNFFSDVDKNGNRVKNGETGEMYGGWGTTNSYHQVQLIGKEGDLKHYFPIYTSGVKFYSSYTGKSVTLSNKIQYINDFSDNVGNWNGDFFIGKTDSNGLCTIKLRQYIQKPIELIDKVDGEWQYNYMNTTPIYVTYGKNKRKIDSYFNLDVRPLYGGVHPVGRNDVNITGIPLIINPITGENNYYNSEVYESNKVGGKIKFDNKGWINGFFSTALWGNMTIKIDEIFILNEIPYNIDIFNKEIHKVYNKNEVYLVGRQQSKFPYLEYGLGISKWIMSKNNKKLATIYSKQGGNLTGNGESYENYFNVIVNSFDPLFMFDREKSSMGEILVVIKDIDMTPDYTPPKQIIELAEVTFKYLNIKALRQNTSQKPKFVLPDEVYLNFKDGNGALSDRIKAKLSFSNEKDNLTFIEMEDKSGDYAGGNNTKVYLHIEPDEYKKMLLNGHGKKYQVFGNYVNNIHGVPDERDTKEVVKIGVVATTTPDGGNRYEPFYSTVLDSLNVISRAVIPIPYTVKFKENEPLIKNDLQLINNSIKYLNAPSEYNYNSNVSLKGIVKPYDYFIKAHRYEITDTTGKTLADYTGSSGSGTYWEDLSLGKNKVTIYHKRDFGITDGYQTRELTFLKLSEWNFEEYEGHIIEKHFLPHSDYVNQYYDIGIRVPSFNPHIYYDEEFSDIKLNKNIIVQKQSGTTIYDLGEIKTKNYDTEITKHTTGSLKDDIGLRIIIGGLVTLKEKESGLEHTTKAEIVFLNDSGQEILYDINNPNIMIGKNQKVRVGLKLPKNIDSSKDYQILGGGTGILDKNNNIPQKQFILAIGRNKYFKEIISNIEIKAEKLVGNFTINFDNDYSIREMVKFNSTTLNKREPISIENIKGVTLSEIEGAGFLQMENGDILQITDKEGNITNISINSSLSSKLTKILFKDKITEISFKVLNGKLNLGLNMWKFGAEENLNLKLFRQNREIMDINMKLKTPTSQFIITHREDLDFGKVIEGSKNNYTEANIEIINSGNSGKLSFELSDTTPILENLNEEKLQVKEINGGIFEKGNNKYQLKLNGKLDVPEKAKSGAYSGSITMRIFIK